MKKTYAHEYDGEYIVTSATIKNGGRTETREWVDYTVNNSQHNRVAYVIGNGPSRQDFKLELFKKVHGGNLAKRMGQTYGCNALLRDFEPDFAVVRSREIAFEIEERNLAPETIKYSWANNIIQCPGIFHLLPYNLPMCAGAAALYLACFDEHREIFLLGFDGQLSPGTNSNIYADTRGYAASTANTCGSAMIRDVVRVFALYSDVSFYVVTDAAKEKQWLPFRNVSWLTYRQFVSMQGLG